MASTAGSPCGHTAPSSPHCHLLVHAVVRRPRPEGIQFSPTRDRGNPLGGPKLMKGRRRLVARGFPRPAAHPPAAGNPPQAPRGPPTLTRSVPQAQLYSLCVDFKTGRVILKHCRNIILDRQNGRKRAKRLCLNARHPLNTLRLPAPQLRKPSYIRPHTKHIDPFRNPCPTPHPPDPALTDVLTRISQPQVMHTGTNKFQELTSPCAGASQP